MLNKHRMLTPGPTPIPSRVRLVMAQEMVHHRKDVFKKVMLDIQPKLQALFGTSGPVLPLNCSGTGSMTAAVHGLFAKGEKVLVLEAGKFGERWVHIAETHGCEVQRVSLPWGEAFDSKCVAQILDADTQIRGVFIQLSETSTGVLHPVAQIASITRERNVLLVVDGISAVGISPCAMDALGIDCLLTGSQKGLMVPPGLSLLALSTKAWEKAQTIPQDCFYFNLVKERTYVEKGQTTFTTPVSLILALHESLQMLFEEGVEKGLDTLYRKQWALTLMARQGLQSIGFTPFVKEHFTWGLTSVLVPEGVNGSEIVRHAAEKYGIIVASGQDAYKDRMIRLGHMGYVDWADVCAGLHALAMSLQHAGGYSASRDYLEKALAVYHAALEVPPGTPISHVWS